MLPAWVQKLPLIANDTSPAISCARGNHQPLTVSTVVLGVLESLQTLYCSILTTCVVSIDVIFLSSTECIAVCSIIVILTHHSESC